MASLVEYPLESGGQLVAWSELPASTAAPTTRGLHGGDVNVVERAERTFEESVAHIKPATESLLALFTDMSHGPEEVSIEFGLSLHAQLGAVISSAGGDANINVTLTWRGSHS